MPKFTKNPGITSLRQEIFIADTSKKGEGLTGLVFSTANLDAAFIRDGDAAATVITLVTAVVGTYTSSGFIEVDSVKLPGVYEVGIPDAAVERGADSVLIMYRGANKMPDVPLEIQLKTEMQDLGNLGAVTAAITSSRFDTDLSVATANFFNGLSLVWSSGLNRGLPSRVIAYDGGGTRRVTLDKGLPFAPIVGDEFIILGVQAPFTSEEISLATFNKIMTGTPIEGSFTFRDLIRIMSAVLAGREQGGLTNEVTFASVADSSKIRVTAQIDVQQNRNVVTHDATDV